MFHKREQIDQLLNQTNLPNSSIFFKGSKKTKLQHKNVLLLHSGIAGC